VTAGTIERSKLKEKKLQLIPQKMFALFFYYSSRVFEEIAMKKETACMITVFCASK